jgi:hypothetical protein
VPSTSQVPRNAMRVSPSGPSCPAPFAGTQSIGSSAVGPESASTVQSSQSCAGSSGQAERRAQGAATAAAAGSGGVKVRVEVTAKVPTGSGTASTRATGTSMVGLACSGVPGTSTQPAATMVGPTPIACTSTALVQPAPTSGKLTLVSPIGSRTEPRNGGGGSSASIAPQVLSS